MGRVVFIWDLEDDPEGNYWHICVEGHGVTREEVEEVLAANYKTATRSRSSGQPETFGWTAGGKYLTVVFERVSDDPLTVYPITARASKVQTRCTKVSAPQKIACFLVWTE